MSIKPTTKEAKKTNSTTKAVKVKKSANSKRTGKSDPASEIEKAIGKVKYQDINDTSDAGGDDRIHQTFDESDNVGRDIYYK